MSDATFSPFDGIGLKESAFSFFDAPLSPPSGPFSPPALHLVPKSASQRARSRVMQENTDTKEERKEEERSDSKNKI